MDKLTRTKLSMASRALDFANAHPISDSGFTTTVQRLGATVARGDTAAKQVNEGTTGESAARARRQTLKRTIGAVQLRRLVAIAKLAAETHPELAGLFIVPDSRMPTKTFLLAAQTILDAIPPHKDLFTSLGLGDTFIADLTQATTDMDGTTETVHTGHSERVGAHVDLKKIARDCMRDVSILDTFYRAAYAEGSDILGAWDSARNVAGPFRHEAETADPAPAPEPQPEPVPAPVAVSPRARDGDEPMK